MRSALSMSLIAKLAAYLFTVVQVSQLLCPNRLNAHWAYMVISHPDICESGARSLEFATQLRLEKIRDSWRKAWTQSLSHRCDGGRVSPRKGKNDTP